MMFKQKSLIGLELDSSIRTIEESQLAHLPAVFTRNNNTSDGIYQHLPTFLLGNLINLTNIYKILNINGNNVLLSRESITALKHLAAGDSIKIRTFLKAAYEQQASGNPLGFIVLETIGIKEKEIIFYCERVIALRGGFQRGRS